MQTTRYLLSTPCCQTLRVNHEDARISLKYQIALFFNNVSASDNQLLLNNI